MGNYPPLTFPIGLIDGQPTFFFLAASCEN